MHAFFDKQISFQQNAYLPCGKPSRNVPENVCPSGVRTTPLPLGTIDFSCPPFACKSTGRVRTLGGLDMTRNAAMARCLFLCVVLSVHDPHIHECIATTSRLLVTCNPTTRHSILYGRNRNFFAPHRFPDAAERHLPHRWLLRGMAARAHSDQRMAFVIPPVMIREFFARFRFSPSTRINSGFRL